MEQLFGEVTEETSEEPPTATTAKKLRVES